MFSLDVFNTLGEGEIVSALDALLTKEKTVKAPRVRPQATRLSADLPVKVALFGPIASGKTKFLEGPLICGERILSLSTDFGGNGLLTVKNGLKKLGRSELVENVINVDVSVYEDVIEFLDDPVQFFKDIGGAEALLQFDPTVFFWDGGSTCQIDYLDEYSDRFPDKIASMSGDKYRHWYDIKRATSRMFKKYFALTLSGKPMHKIMTFVEDKQDVNEITQVTEKAPLIQGGAKALCTGGFDVVLNCFSEEEKGGSGELKYYYRTKAASGKYAVKNRDFNLKPVEEASPERIWRLLTGKETK